MVFRYLKLNDKSLTVSLLKSGDFRDGILLHGMFNIHKEHTTIYKLLTM